MFSISKSRTDLVRLRILLSTISSFCRLPPRSIAPEPHCVERAVCEFTQRINEQLFRWLGGRNVLEQPFPRFVPVDYELMGGVVAHQLLECLVAEIPASQLQSFPVLLHNPLRSLVLGKP